MSEIRPGDLVGEEWSEDERAEGGPGREYGLKRVGRAIRPIKVRVFGGYEDGWEIGLTKSGSRVHQALTSRLTKLG